MITLLGESQGSYPRLPVYNYFLGSCAKMQSIGHANQCLELMEHRMVGKNEVTYLQLLKVCRIHCFIFFLCSSIFH